jgi:hypothetical protein
MKILVSIINESSVLTDEQVIPVVAALQKQVSNDFAPVWGIDATLTFVAKGQKPNPQSWWLVLLDDSDQAGALGYHDLTDQGYPMGKVFCKTDLDNGSSWSCTVSHELLEMLGDPDINLCALYQDGRNSLLYSYEVCDACEDDSFGYMIDGVLVSDFVYPSWFSPAAAASQYDKQGKITQPLQLLAGGYISVLNLNSNLGWQQLTADTKKYSMRARPGSRRERRNVGRSQWIKSCLK